MTTSGNSQKITSYRICTFTDAFLNMSFFWPILRCSSLDVTVQIPEQATSQNFGSPATHTSLFSRGITPGGTTHKLLYEPIYHYYNFTSDQFSGFNAIVIPGTVRDSLYILEGLLEQQTSLNPIEIMADTAGTSDLVFGLFWLLGYQFSARIADIGGARFWRIDAEADYGPLDGLARNRINSNLITDHWDDMLRVAGSLKLGTVHATDMM